MHATSGRIARTAMMAAGALATFFLSASVTKAQDAKTLIVALESEPPTLNLVVPSLATEIIMHNVMNLLVQLDFNMDPVPDLADSWEVSEDGLVYTFNINPDAVWHDGVPVTSADVVYSLRDVRCGVAPRRSPWCDVVEAFEAPDDHTFILRLSSPFAPLMTMLGDWNSEAAIYPQHVYEGRDITSEAANDAIGSGAFKLGEWVRGSHLELVRNPDYFKSGKPYLDRIVFQFMPDATARLLAFENGEVDFLYSYIVPLEQVSRLRADPRFTVVERGLEGPATVFFLLMNTKSEPLANPRLRQAIAYALDRDEILEKAQFGEGKVAHSHLGSGIAWAFTDAFDIYKRDLARAAEILDAEGFPADADGKRFTLQLVVQTGVPFTERAQEVIRSQLREIGIEVEIRPYDVAAYLDTVYAQFDFDLAIQNMTTGTDPTTSVPIRYRASSIGDAYTNGMQYENPELEALFDVEFTRVDRAERQETWRSIQQILMDDLPVLPLVEVPSLQLQSAKFTDLVVGPLGYIDSRENARLVE